MVGDDVGPFVLHTRIRPSSRFNELLPGTSKIERAIMIVEYQPLLYTMDITLTGKLDDDVERMIDQEIKLSLTTGGVIG